MGQLSILSSIYVEGSVANIALIIVCFFITPSRLCLPEERRNYRQILRRTVCVSYVQDVYMKLATPCFAYLCIFEKWWLVTTTLLFFYCGSFSVKISFSLKAVKSWFRARVAQKPQCKAASARQCGRSATDMLYTWGSAVRPTYAAHGVCHPVDWPA